MSRSESDPDGMLMAVAAGVLFTSLLTVYSVAQLGAWISGGPGLPPDPFESVFGLLFGRLEWPAAAPLAAALIAVPLAVAGVGLWWLRRRWRKRRKRGDDAGRHLARGRELAPLTTDAAKIRDEFGLTGAPGLPIGVSVVGRVPLFQDWEAVALQIWPPRKGKTSTQSIRRIVTAPGPVVATTNKGGRREVVAATRGVRERLGTVWVMDPQGIAGETPGRMWWNPLRDVTGVVQARALVKVWADAQREPGARSDPYFDPEGQNLLANDVLAAAADGRPITDVLGWLDNPNDTEPVRLLRRYGYEAQAKSVQAIIDLGGNGEQRGGVFRTAANLMSWLGSPEVQAWCVQPHSRTPEFIPEDFVHSEADTLYLLSREGEGTTAPLITALTVAVCEAALRYARSLPAGRLSVPMVVELDEAANICKWRDLPDLYSHFGSQGIVVTTYLQSWPQGVAVWGREGMGKLWGASNVAVIGPGLRDPGTLRDVSELIGDHDVPKVSYSSSRSGHSRSETTERRRILSPAALGSLPKGRMVVLASGAPPTIAEPVSWWDTDQQSDIVASQRRYAYDPAVDEASVMDERETVSGVVAALSGRERDVPSTRQLREANPWLTP